MSLAGKILTGALLKIRSDRVTFESVNRSYSIFETCNKICFNYQLLVRTLLAERNHAVLNKIIKKNLSSLFKFRHVGILFAEKSRQAFDPLKHSLYSLIVGEDADINSDFRLTDSHLVLHSAQSGMTGLAIQ